MYCTSRFVFSSFVFSLDSMLSFQELDAFFADYESMYLRDSPDGAAKPIIIVGNKLDIVEANVSKREVPREQAEMLARRYSAVYIETSAMMNTGVEEMFKNAIEMWCTQAPEYEGDEIYSEDKSSVECSICTVM
jgi:hypothetical protein